MGKSKKQTKHHAGKTAMVCMKAKESKEPTENKIRKKKVEGTTLNMISAATIMDMPQQPKTKMRMSSPVKCMQQMPSPRNSGKPNAVKSKTKLKRSRSPSRKNESITLHQLPKT